MQTVSFKKNSGATTTNFDAVVIRTRYFENKHEYIDINNTFRKILRAKWKEFEISFGRLQDTNQDYLEELKTETAPQFIYNSVTYDIIVISLNNRAQKGQIVVRNTVKET